MKQVKEFSQSNCKVFPAHEDNVRVCPKCGLFTLKGMPGGKDAICSNCGYKDPCCSD